MISWHVAYCGPREESLAKGEIEKIGFITFLPMLSRAKVVRRKRQILLEPIFVRYLFIAFDPAHNTYGAIKRCRGVQYLLESQTGLQRVPNEEIALLMKAERHGLFDFSKPKAKFAEGDEVQITEGPFTGLIAKVQSASPRKRIKILMKLLGGDVNLDIPAEELEKVA